MDEEMPTSVDVVVASRREVLHLAPVIHELKSKARSDVRIIALQCAEKDLPEILSSVDLQTDMQWTVRGADCNSGLFLSEINLLLSELWGHRRPHWFLNFGHHDTTLTASVAAFHNQIPIAHIEDLNDFNSEKFFSAHLQRSHRSVAVLAELLFTPSAFAKNALIHEGINENMIYSVGSTLSDITHLIMQGYSRSDCLRTLFSSLSNLRMQQIIRGDFLILDLLYPSNIHKTVELLPRIIELNKDFLPIFISRDINMVDSFRQQSCLEGILSLEHVNHLQRCSLLAQASCVVTDNEDTLEECTAYGTKGILLKEHTGRFDLISSGLATIAAPQPELLCGQIISARRGNHQKSLHLPSLHASSTATASKQIVQALLTSRTSGISQKSKTEPLSRRAG